MPRLVFSTPADGQYFAGYYDKSPLDASNRRLLAQRAQFIDRMVEAGDRLEIGFFDWRERSAFTTLAETSAWNWQQGCMLQWLGPDHTARIVYNDRRDGQFVSVVRDIATGHESILPMAVYTVNRQGTQALCIDFERHYWFRPGYNYQGIENTAKRRPLDERDGIWLLELQSGRLRQVVNIVALVETSHLSSMDGGAHYLEHAMFAPSGRRFSFLHRWKMEDGGVYARLYTANADGSGIRLLSDSGRMSHFSWLDDEQIVAYGGARTRVNRIRRHREVVRFLVRPLLPLYHALVPAKSSFRKSITGDGYMIFNDKTGGWRPLAPAVLRRDGHPTCCPSDPDILLSDTYEDADHNREVFLVDMKTGQKVWSEKLKSIADFDSTGMRCDLHPKWSFDGTHVAVDTMNDGCRGIRLYRRT